MPTGLLTRGLSGEGNTLVTGGLGIVASITVGIVIRPLSIISEEEFGVEIVVYQTGDGGETATLPRLRVRTLSKVERRTIR